MEKSQHSVLATVLDKAMEDNVLLYDCMITYQISLPWIDIEVVSDLLYYKYSCSECQTLHVEISHPGPLQSDPLYRLSFVSH